MQDENKEQEQGGIREEIRIMDDKYIPSILCLLFPVDGEDEVDAGDGDDEDSKDADTEGDAPPERLEVARG